MSPKAPRLDPLTRARGIVYRMLSFRPRSEQEIRDRLHQKDFRDSDVRRTIQYFKELELIDDRSFARQWITSRLRRPLGPRRIQRELLQKGVDATIIQEEMRTLLDGYPQEKVLDELIHHRLERLREIDPPKQRRRLVEFLQRRGFDLSDIIKALHHHDC